MAATGLWRISIPNSTAWFDNRRNALPWMSGSEFICRTSRKLPCFRRGRLPVKVSACVPNPRVPKTRLYVSGLSFRTTEESLRNAFQNFGKLLEVNLVMDKIANRPRGFAFLRYATEEESQKAIEGMHGKFLDGRVIFVEVAKSRTELRQGLQNKKF